METQNRIILSHLRQYGTITSLQAFQLFSITRLSGRIYDLRQLGHNIVTIYKTSERGGRYAVYRLIEDGE